MITKKFLGVQGAEFEGTIGIEFDKERGDFSKYEIVAGDEKMRISEREFSILKELFADW